MNVGDPLYIKEAAIRANGPTLFGRYLFMNIHNPIHILMSWIMYLQPLYSWSREYDVFFLMYTTPMRVSYGQSPQVNIHFSQQYSRTGQL